MLSVFGSLSLTPGFVSERKKRTFSSGLWEESEQLWAGLAPSPSSEQKPFFPSQPSCPSWTRQGHPQGSKTLSPNSWHPLYFYSIIS